MYQNIVFLQEHEAIEAVDILLRDGREAALDYLLQWECGEGGDETETPPWGSEDHTYRFGDYFVSYNPRIPYIGLCKRS